MDIGAISTASQFQAAPVVPRSVEQPAQPKPERVEVAPKILAVEKTELRASEEQRVSAVREAALRAQRENYPVRDTTVAIFKDASGQYITRFTSLRDGTVTYVPEPNLLRRFSAGSAYAVSA